MINKTINDWIDGILAIIAKRLPKLIEKNPGSFLCGHEVGYKQALLDIEQRIEEGYELRKSKCWCKDKFHEPGEVCL